MNIAEARNGQRVYNETYGAGTVFDARIDPRTVKEGVEDSGGIKLLAVRFDKGGPQGWAKNATHDVADLQVIQ